MLNPARRSRDWMDKTKAGADASKLRLIATQYNQRPGTSKGSLFKSWMLGFKYDGPPKGVVTDRIVGTLDATFKGLATSDYVVLQIWGMKDEYRYLLDQYRAQATFSETLKAVIEMKRKWPMMYEMLIEDKANGSAIIDALKNSLADALKDNKGFSRKMKITEFNPGTKSKYERAQVGSEPLFAKGMILLPEERYCPWIKGYIERHVGFDGSGTPPDDEIDATSMMGIYWQQNQLSVEDMIKKKLAEMSIF